jgi:Endonuclease-reverse transcriptase
MALGSRNTIINIYNCPRSQTLQILRETLLGIHHKFIIASDFNLHHPLWNPKNYLTYDSAADDAIEIMNDPSVNPHDLPWKCHLPSCPDSY